MTDERKQKIEKICKDFASGFDIPIAGSGWAIVDPMSAFLIAVGYPNELNRLGEGKPVVLMMTFEDGTKFIPAGSDVDVPNVGKLVDWIWIDKP